MTEFLSHWPFCFKAVRTELVRAKMGCSSIKCVAPGAVTSWTLRTAAEQKGFNGKVLYSYQDLQAFPSLPGLHGSNKAHLTQSEPLLGFRCWRGSWVTLPSYKKVTFISNITFTRISLEELVSLQGCSYLQTQLLFSLFFHLLVPRTI